MAHTFPRIVRALVQLPRIARIVFQVPERGDIDFGDLRRLQPFCIRWGKSRGRIIGRYFVEKFLRAHCPGIRGKFLEFGDPRYRDLFGPSGIDRYDVIDLTKDSPVVTIVGDIQDIPHIDDNTYDCIICTQVLEHVPNPFRAVAEMHRILKKGGILLLTVPHISRIHADPLDCWRFTEEGLRLLTKDFSTVQIEPRGNLLVSTSCLFGLAVEDLTTEELEYIDSDYPYLYTVKAIK